MGQVLPVLCHGAQSACLSPSRQVAAGHQKPSKCPTHPGKPVERVPGWQCNVLGSPSVTHLRTLRSTARCSPRTAMPAAPDPAPEDGEPVSSMLSMPPKSITARRVASAFNARRTGRHRSTCRASRDSPGSPNTCTMPLARATSSLVAQPARAQIGSVGSAPEPLPATCAKCCGWCYTAQRAKHGAERQKQKWAALCVKGNTAHTRTPSLHHLHYARRVNVKHALPCFTLQPRSHTFCGILLYSIAARLTREAAAKMPHIQNFLRSSHNMPLCEDNNTV
jgi:hypothetical protein